MPFGLKNADATYVRAMTTIFHDMIHKEIEVYLDDVIIKSRESSDHLTHLRKFFERLRRYNLKLNPAKCAFEVPAGKLLGFIVSRRGIELDPSKIKAIQEFPLPKTRKESYLSNPPLLVPPREGSPLLLYLSVSDSAFGCVLGQHDETGKKEKVIYYISKKFTPYESRYTLLERTCCAVTWLAQKLRHYLSSYTTYLISRIDPLKVIFQKAMPTGKLAKWQMLLSAFDIVYVTQKAIKAQALADHLAENPVDEEYKPLRTYFHNEEVSFVGEDISEAYQGWRLFFDGAANHQGKGVGAVLVSKSGQHYPMAAKLRFNCANNMAEYKACILGLKMAIDMNVYELLVIGDSDLLIHQVQGEWAVKNSKIVPYVQYVQNLCKRFCKIEFRHTPRIQNELVDALATIASMIKHPDTDYIDPLDIDLKQHPVHCSHVESEPDDLPWYFDIKRYLESGTYPEDATSNQKKSIRRMVLNFFLNGEVLYRRTPDLGLLRCVDAAEPMRLIEQIHAGVCGTHMNGLTLARKVLRADYSSKVNSLSPQMNGVVQAANKNIKKILRKMIDKQRGWHEMLPYALLGYRTTVRTSTGATPYLLVYGTEAVVPVEVEIPSLRIIQEAELSNAEWVYSFALKSAEFTRRMNTESSQREENYLQNQ
ncbi:uncharacterized protein [Solanum lycopersicum]|uniref:uncharacterized protein n=1 Tax=Solanum lycopersicum TaxID=4081 RepID=UPI00374886C0